jgi:hypothetical protein
MVVRLGRKWVVWKGIHWAWQRVGEWAD